MIKTFLVNSSYSTPVEDSGGKAAAHLSNLVPFSKRNIMPFQ